MFQPAPLDRAPTADQLIRGFHQGSAGNCASIAVIKAALMAFGTRSMFANVREDAEGDLVTVRDGTTGYRVSTAEMDAAQRLSHFEGTDGPLLSHANYVFAVMIKRVQLEGSDGRSAMSFEQAAATLNDGENWLEGPKWLGLRALVIRGPNPRIPLVPGPGRFLSRHPAGIGKSPGHTWFASMGVHDHWGNPGGAPIWMSGAIALDVAAISRL